MSSNRISLGIDEFKNLCEDGFVYIKDTNTNQDEFTKLCSGEVVDTGDYKIALQDIGWGNIFRYVSVSRHYTFE